MKKAKWLASLEDGFKVKAQSGFPAESKELVEAIVTHLSTNKSLSSEKRMRHFNIRSAF